MTTQYLTEAEACDLVGLITGGRLVALAAPDELRRLAMGGDILEVETTDLFDGARLQELPVIRALRQLGPRRLRITVDDAGTATPDVVEAVERSGGQVAAAREERPSFDEVFGVLVERERSSRNDASDASDGRERP